MLSKENGEFTVYIHRYTCVRIVNEVNLQVPPGT